MTTELAVRSIVTRRSSTVASRSGQASVSKRYSLPFKAMLGLEIRCHSCAI